MKTIPQMFGVETSKQIALWSLALYELMSILHFFVAGFSFSLLIGLLFTSLYVGFLIYKTNEERSDTFYTFWLEGSSIIMYLLLFIIPLAFGIFAP
jgi:4-hydroxybenzoate polyprenyltransferase